MAYGDLYQRRRPAVSSQPTPSPQPNGVSFVEHMRRLHPPALDASAGLNESERAQVREWRRLIDAKLLGFGTIIPAHLLAAVYDGCAPQGAPCLLEAASDPAGRIARQITAGLATDTPISPRHLATDQAPRPRNDLATDQEPHRPTMSYKLAQIFGDYSYLDEDSMDESMQQWGVTEPRDRIGLKTEAMALGMLRPRGQAPKLPARYIQAPHVNNPRLPHFISKDSPAAQRSTAGRPDTPGKKHGLTMQASSDGFAPENTSIWVSDAGTGLDTL